MLAKHKNELSKTTCLRQHSLSATAVWFEVQAISVDERNSFLMDRNGFLMERCDLERNDRIPFSVNLRLCNFKVRSNLLKGILLSLFCSGHLIYE